MGFFDVAVGEPAEVVPSRSCLTLAVTIALPCVAGAVKAVAVELDCEAMLGPAAVDQPSVCRPIR
jgi:hypothetical protein